MNSPMNAPPPIADGEGTHFDFEVQNPIIPEQGYKYTIVVMDFDRYIDDIGGGWGEDRPIANTAVSIRRLSVFRNQAVKGDTLWLMAKDYAAHCVVTPRCSSPNRLRLRDVTSPYYEDEPLWSITVPRDDDGYQLVGVNRGDFMADAWEEDVFNLDRYDPAILNFYPFYVRYTDGQLFHADNDTLPIGRGIDGDRFANWDEYRGFEVTGEPDSGFYQAARHVRLDPRRKSVTLGWQDRVEGEITDNVPGFLDLLTDIFFGNLGMELYFIRSYWLDDDRVHIKKYINRNQLGASFPYFGVSKITDKPSDFPEQAVIFFQSSRAEILPLELGGNLWFGGTFGLSAERRGYTTPERHLRSWIHLYNIDRWEDSTYYAANPLQWTAAKDSLIQFLMIHEFSHSIGMTDLNNDSLMDGRVPVQGNSAQPDYGKFFYDPSFSISYCDSSRNQLNVKEEK